MRLASIALVSVVLCVGVLLATACSSSDGGERAESTGTGTTEPGAAPSAFAPADASAPCTTCSADLTRILSCGASPSVLETCGPGLACAAGGCIPACEAAVVNKSSIGCDYYAVRPAAHSFRAVGAPSGNCFAAFVTNAWSTPMKVDLVWRGKKIDAAPYAYLPKGTGALSYEPVPLSGVPANSTAIVFLNQTFDPTDTPIDRVQCPAGTKAAIEDEDIVVRTADSGVFNHVGRALRIETSLPSVVYDIYPYGGARSYVPSATLLLPTNVWDTNYVAATMAAGQFLSGFDVVALRDGTQVTILPSADAPGGDARVPPARRGTPVTYTIDQGEMLHLMNSRPDQDLGGSVIQTNVPVGVWGEHECMFQAAATWRLVGAVDDTVLSFDPPVPGAPAKLTRGEVLEIAAPAEALRVRSQDRAHPFYLAAHRPGRNECDSAHQQIPPVRAMGSEYVAATSDPATYRVGGPETVNVVPVAQFLPTYQFMTDPTFTFTELVLIRSRAKDGAAADVSLDCLGIVGGWKPVGNGQTHEYTRVRLSGPEGPTGACGGGLHTIRSDVPFGVTVWGYDDYASYAYPAGASAQPINTVIVPPTLR